MSGQEKSAQLRVGIFMAIGLGAVAAMVVYFGRFGEAVRSYYPLTVEYPNASGILKGASVLLAGAKVGVVDTPPVLMEDLEGVRVGLKIYEDVEIPSASEFTVGSSGLLGDRFIQIILKPKAKESPPIQPGAVIKGKGETGLSDLMDQAGPFIAEIRDTVKKVNNIATKLDEELLNDDTLKNLNATVANLQATSASFTEASKKIDGIIQKADSAVGTGDQAMAAAKSAAEELKKAIGDIRVVIQQTRQGRGALGVLLSDKQTADNLKALVANLRARGIIWYKDRSEPPPSR